MTTLRMSEHMGWTYGNPYANPLASKLGNYSESDTKPSVKPKIVEEVSHPVAQNSLSVAGFVENDQLACGSVHKVWGLVELRTNKPPTSQPNLSFDFVIIVDHSESMQNDGKLAYVQATIDYLIAKLGKEHRLCLIKFNQQVTMLTTGLQDLVPQNKTTISQSLKEIQPEGTTNISDALFTGLKVLKERPSTEHSRLSFVMLFTGSSYRNSFQSFSDGIATDGLRGTSFMTSLKDYTIPSGCTIHTFGYGADHDSRTLQKLSLSSLGGVYHFIEAAENIPPTFGECLAGRNPFSFSTDPLPGILSTAAYNVNVRLVGCDGCRIVQFYTMYGVQELQEVKDYNISFGSLSLEETRGLLFKLSLRKMDDYVKQHNLVKVIVTYTDAFTGLDCKAESFLSAERTKTEILKPIPVQLDLHINRFTAASAIETAIEKANAKQFDVAQKHLEQVIETARNSSSFKNSSTGQYIEDLIADLSLCKSALSCYEVFVEKGTHYSYAFATMYYMERSTGTRNLLGHSSLVSKGKDQFEDMLPCNVKLTETKPPKRSSHYGYVSFYQEQQRTEASKEVSSFLSTYYADGSILKQQS